jgi:hypothetical protein
MSQNGPYSGHPWSRGSSDEPYSEPADPWSDHGSAVPDPAWGAHPPSVPQQPVSYPPSTPLTGSSGWTGPPPPPPAKRNTPIVALVVTLSVLICIGLGTTAWLLKQHKPQSPSAQQSQSVSTTAANPGPAPAGSEDARYNVKVGDCVVNEGTDQEPEMRTTPCTDGTYQVLARIRGKTTGEKDAESKCAKVRGYTKWYFYDSGFDDLDFVLCLKEH